MNDADTTNSPEDELVDEKQLAEQAEAAAAYKKAEAPLTIEEESFKDKYQRTRADLDNIQRRMREERSTQRINTIVNFTKELLPFIDNLDRAIAAADEETELVKGLKMSRSQLNNIFESNNIKKVPTDVAFDPQLHEAVTSIENTELPSNSISAVLEDGYMLGDRVIRYGKVQVTTGGPEAEA
jgi:molecular chaperone GrpE